MECPKRDETIKPNPTIKIRINNVAQKIAIEISLKISSFFIFEVPYELSDFKFKLLSRLASSKPAIRPPLAQLVITHVTKTLKIIKTKKLTTNKTQLPIGINFIDEVKRLVKAEGLDVDKLEPLEEELKLLPKLIPNPPPKRAMRAPKTQSHLFFQPIFHDLLMILLKSTDFSSTA